MDKEFNKESNEATNVALCREYCTKRYAVQDTVT